MRRIALFIMFFAFVKLADAQSVSQTTFDFNAPQQTIHSFGASDCWRTQYIGENWPEDKRNQMADLLFSTKTDDSGAPIGIGLSMWRFNIGSGSHEAGEASGVASDWRRTECFLSEDGTWDWTKQKGQRWMLNAAKERGVKYTLGFSISAPYFMSKNGMTRCDSRTPYSNIRPDAYDDYASFLAEVSTELQLDYLSPINEPQWEWVGTNQEGMQATNQECAEFIRHIDSELIKRNSVTKIVFGEAGDIRYLYRDGTDKPLRDNQISEMFSEDGENSIIGCKTVDKVISGHSYWSTWPLDTLVTVRKELRSAIPSGYSYWQTEYCPMEKNEDNPNGGGGRDISMNTALYVARVIHYDLTVANASSWQWWTAFSEWDYKDGLIFIDDGNLPNGASRGDEPMIESCKSDGVYRTSKLLWALGNFSRFIRPGMVRIPQIEPTDDILASCYADTTSKTISVVLINNSIENRSTELIFNSLPDGYNADSFRIYETSEDNNLKYSGVAGEIIHIPARSIVTLTNIKM